MGPDLHKADDTFLRARAKGLTKQALYWRLRHGWTLVRALTWPVRKKRKAEGGPK